MSTTQAAAGRRRAPTRQAADAASAVFGERGLDAPLEAIARRAGVSTGTLYNHFPARDGVSRRDSAGATAALEQIAVTAMHKLTHERFAGFARPDRAAAETSAQ